MLLPYQIKATFLVMFNVPIFNYNLVNTLQKFLEDQEILLTEFALKLAVEDVLKSEVTAEAHSEISFHGVIHKLLDSVVQPVNSLTVSMSYINDICVLFFKSLNYVNFSFKV